MIRTQIYIPDPLHKELTRIAQVKGEPMAKVVRDILEEKLEHTEYADYSGKRALRTLLALRFTGGPNDLSTNLDHYLYGAPKKETEAE